MLRRYRRRDGAGGALWFKRSTKPAWGLAGGSDAKGPESTLGLPDGSEENPLKMRARVLPKGTLLITRTGGGGGYGNPLARPFDEIQRDLDRGWLSPAVATEDYGVVIRDGRVDAQASTPRASL